MADLSKQMANRVKWARYVLSSYRTHGAKLVDELKAQYAEFEDDGSGNVVGVEALEATLELLNRRLKAVTNRMEGGELAVAAELADDDEVRGARDDLFESGRGQFYEARDVIGRALGPQSVKTYALDQTPPSTPDELRAALKNAVNLMKQKPQTGQDSFGNAYDTNDIVKTLEPTVAELEDALDAVDQESREATDARAHRNTLVAEWTVAYRGTARTLSGLYELAGRGDLAERVRPTVASTDGRTEPPKEPVDEDVTEPV